MMRLADLVEDMTVYPRLHVDSGHVSELARTITAGHAVPAPVVDEASRRIVDGVHRCRAWRKVLGANGEIDVELRSYPDELALLTDAIQLNSGHARKLDAQDKIHCALLLENRAVPVPVIALTLHTTESRVRELLVRVVIVKGDDGSEKRVAAKLVTYPAHGGAPRVISAEQGQVMRSSGGLRTAQAARQLARELESGLIELGDDPDLPGVLWGLHDVIAATVPRP